MKNFIVLIILAVILTLAISYIVKNKKKGIKCIGCPYAGSCTENSCDDCNHSKNIH